MLPFTPLTMSICCLSSFTFLFLHESLCLFGAMCKFKLCSLRMEAIKSRNLLVYTCIQNITILLFLLSFTFRLAINSSYLPCWKFGRIMLTCALKRTHLGLLHKFWVYCIITQCTCITGANSPGQWVEVNVRPGNLDCLHLSAFDPK